MQRDQRQTDGAARVVLEQYGLRNLKNSLFAFWLLGDTEPRAAELATHAKKLRQAVALLEAVARIIEKRQSATPNPTMRGRAIRDAEARERLIAEIKEWNRSLSSSDPRRRSRDGAKRRRRGRGIEYGRRWALSQAIEALKTGDSSLGPKSKRVADANERARAAGEYVAAIARVIGVDRYGSWSNQKKRYQKMAAEMTNKKKS